MKVFEKSLWIWAENCEGNDSYADFYDSINYTSGKVLMNLSCDNDYTLYINGVYVASNQYGDFEHYKIYDTLDITPYLSIGENAVKILVYHTGASTQRYIPAKEGLIYEILCDGEVVCASSVDTLSRKDPAYISGRQKFITTQLGFSFTYDARLENEGEGLAKSIIVDKKCTFYPRPIKKQAVYERVPMKSVTMLGEARYLIDLGGEVVGLPVLEFTSNIEQKLTVAFGEHIEDGCVRMLVGGRDFSYEYFAKEGKNIFNNYMLRLGCRYLEIFAESPIEIDYVGVLPQVYETNLLPVEIESEFDREVYKLSLNTMKMSMMEHYVDCPWREQALYTFDSRNQMLFGYYAYADKNADYVRANLRLIGMDRRADGLLSICYPAGSALSIPSFTLYYLLQMKEYAENTGDYSLAKEFYSKMCDICDTFAKQMQNGLVLKFADKNIWNFYDWTAYSDGSLGHAENAVSDLLINCLYVIALDSLEAVAGYIGEKFTYGELRDTVRKNIRKEFFTDKNLFEMHKNSEQYTVLGQTLALFANVLTDKAEREALCDAIVGDSSLVQCSLSMHALKYQVLLGENREKYADFILDELRSNYRIMLDYGATTAWETLKGASDFGDAGSLCHGWSAVPVYIFHELGIAKPIK